MSSAHVSGINGSASRYLRVSCCMAHLGVEKPCSRKRLPMSREPTSFPSKAPSCWTNMSANQSALCAKRFKKRVPLHPAWCFSTNSMHWHQSGTRNRDAACACQGRLVWFRSASCFVLLTACIVLACVMRVCYARHHVQRFERRCQWCQ